MSTNEESEDEFIPLYVKKRGPPGANERPFVRRFRGFLFPPGAPLRRGGVKSWGTPPNPRGGRPHFPPATHVRSSRGCPVGPVKVVASLRSAKRGRLATVSHVSEARSVETKQARVRGTSYRHIGMESKRCVQTLPVRLGHRSRSETAIHIGQ